MTFLKQNLNYLKQSQSVRNVLTVMTGTTIAQIISVLISPILTRLYTPDEFGILAIFTSISSILVILGTMRYEYAIVLPAKDKDGINLTVLPIIVSIPICLIIFLLFYLFNSQISKLLKNDHISFWLYFIPLFVFFQAINQALINWAIRKSKYKGVSASRITLSAINGLGKIIFGLMKTGASGLISPAIISMLISTMHLSILIKNIKKYSLTYVNPYELIRLAKEYKKFPKYMMPGNLINTAAIYFPTLIMTYYYGTEPVGYIALAERVASAPIGIISSSFADVFRQKGSEAFAIQKNCHRLYMKTLKSLIFISFFPFLILFISAPFLFSIIFGDKWLMAGRYAQIMTFMLFIKFINDPLSYVFHFADKQEIALIWQICLFIITSLAIFFGFYFFYDPLYSILFYSISYSLMYLISLLLTYYYSKGNFN